MARSHAKVGRLLGMTELAGTAGAAVVTAGKVVRATSASQTMSVMGAVAPPLAIAQGILSIVQGCVAISNRIGLGDSSAYVDLSPATPEAEKPWINWASVRKNTKIALDLLSGAYLLHGGVAAVAQDYFHKDISLGLGGLYYRFAIYSAVQFLQAVLDVCDAYADDELDDSAKRTRRNALLFTAIKRGFLAAGWCMLGAAHELAETFTNPEKMAKLIEYGCVAFAAAATFVAAPMLLSRIRGTTFKPGASAHTRLSPQRSDRTPLTTNVNGRGAQGADSGDPEDVTDDFRSMHAGRTRSANA